MSDRYKLSSFLNLSCASTVLMALYIAMAGFNIYRLMHPLSGIDLHEYGECEVLSNIIIITTRCSTPILKKIHE